MGKYQALWEWIRENGTDRFSLTFDQVEEIAGVPMDHSFLNEKKNLLPLGYQVEKISLKGKTVVFRRCPGEETREE